MMVKRICPICEQVMKGSHYCHVCHRFVSHPHVADVTYYLNEQRPKRAESSAAQSGASGGGSYRPAGESSYRPADGSERTGTQISKPFSGQNKITQFIEKLNLNEEIENQVADRLKMVLKSDKYKLKPAAKTQINGIWFVILALIGIVFLIVVLNFII